MSTDGIQWTLGDLTLKSGVGLYVVSFGLYFKDETEPTWAVGELKRIYVEALPIPPLQLAGIFGAANFRIYPGRYRDVFWPTFTDGNWSPKTYFRRFPYLVRVTNS